MSKTLPPFVVGQTIFLIPHETRAVIPAVVVEEITKKTINGSQTSWMIFTPSSQKPVKLDTSACEIFTTISDVRKSLFDRVSIAIEEMIVEVEEISSALNKAMQPQQVDDAPTVVTLEDGTKARIK
jgi:hypothetical protein